MCYEIGKGNHISPLQVSCMQGMEPPPSSKRAYLFSLALLFNNNLSILEGVYFINADIWLMHSAKIFEGHKKPTT